MLVLCKQYKKLEKGTVMKKIQFDFNKKVTYILCLLFFAIYYNLQSFIFVCSLQALNLGVQIACMQNR